MNYQRIVCADGASVSIQAGKVIPELELLGIGDTCGLYCTPRNNKGPFTEVEAGYPSVNPPESWMQHCENPDRPTDTVYPYLPYQYVHEFINVHGGMVSGELPPEAK